MFVLELSGHSLLRGFKMFLSNLNKPSAMALKVCQLSEVDCGIETRGTKTLLSLKYETECQGAKSRFCFLVSGRSKYFCLCNSLFHLDIV